MGVPGTGGCGADRATAAIDRDRLVAEAQAARRFARAPYSGFAVGAALLCADGAVYRGCNVETASYGLTCCAERVALFKAVSEGARDFKAIAVVAASSAPPSPCGACRQVLAEFCPGLLVIAATPAGARREWRIEELLPDAFRLEPRGQ